MARPMIRPWACRGMTLIEALACLLVLTMGILAILGLVMQGNALASRAQSATTGLATARTLLYDAAPLGFGDRAVSGNVVSGYLNGYFVRRTRLPAPNLGSQPPVNNQMQASTVTVEVFQGTNGTPVITLQQRLLERCPP